MSIHYHRHRSVGDVIGQVTGRMTVTPQQLQLANHWRVSTVASGQEKPYSVKDAGGKTTITLHVTQKLLLTARCCLLPLMNENETRNDLDCLTRVYDVDVKITMTLRALQERM
eukprot:GILJ01013881.1.p2 GENE.GILJ01013881.1~~GILJ01013881.1.p2  ORF type:complete len:113 (-),score=9.43 GILJ01013881.1:2286-2624(-)